MGPTKPCPFCGTTRYGIVESAKLEFISEAKRKWGNVVMPTVSVCVCTGCGATTLFSRGGDEGLLETCDHKIVDVPSEAEDQG